MRRGALTLALTLVGCASGPAPLPTITAMLGIANGTTLTVQVFVNGTSLTTVAAHDSAEFAPARLPEMPWTVEARTPSGRLLTSFTARSDDMLVRQEGGATVHTVPAGRADLSCGRLQLWVGPLPPSGPAPDPGTPGDCRP